MKRIELALLLATALLLGVAAVRARGVSSGRHPEPGSHPERSEESALAVPSAFSEESLDRAAGDMSSRDPFRLSRTPPTVPFASRRDPAAAPPAPVFRPALSLKGIVGGPPWMAIVDGIPGQPAGLVVRAGRTFEKLSIQSVSRDTVIVQLPDTTLHLTMTKGTR